MDLSHRESSLQRNVFSLDGGAQRMLQGKEYRAVDKVFSIVYGSIHRVTKYTMRPKRIRLQAIYSSVISTVVVRYWKQGWISKELRESEAIVCEFKK